MDHKVYAVSDVPPALETKALILWNGLTYDCAFKGVSKRTGMWEFSGPEGTFFVAPGSKCIRGYS